MHSYHLPTGKQEPDLPISNHIKFYSNLILNILGKQEPDLPISSIWPLLTLVVVALFLLVLGLVIIIILIAWYVLKGSRKDQLPKGVKLFPYRSSMAYNQMRTTLDRGYSSLRRFDPRTANGRRSGYMTTNSLEMAATSTV
eukprot:XP_019926897.1 PREDICTED: uncharacterized protein LOC105337918 [Crassostrea gigas]